MGKEYSEVQRKAIHEEFLGILDAEIENKLVELTNLNNHIELVKEDNKKRVNYNLPEVSLKYDEDRQRDLTKRVRWLKTVQTECTPWSHFSLYCPVMGYSGRYVFLNDAIRGYLESAVNRVIKN